MRDVRIKDLDGVVPNEALMIPAWDNKVNSTVKIDVASIVKMVSESIAPQNVLCKCKHCGQWGAVYCACVSCGAPIDPEKG